MKKQSNSKKNTANLFKIDDPVTWKWMGRTIKGKVIEIYFKPISKIIKGKSIKRNGSDENPAYLVLSEANNEALKLQSELSKFESKKLYNGKPIPKMFS